MRSNRDTQGQSASTVQLDDLLQQYLPRELIEEIDHCNLHLHTVEVQTHAGDVFVLRLTRNTSMKLNRLLFVLLIAGTGWAWHRANGPDASQQEARLPNPTCEARE